MTDDYQRSSRESLIRDWLLNVSPGAEFHPREIATATGIEIDAIENVLSLMLLAPAPIVTRAKARGWYQLQPFDNLDHGKLQRAGAVHHESDETESAFHHPQARQRRSVPDVIGYTPQGQLVTRDDDDIIRIWNAADYTI
jgi:hypothetical protein